VIHERTVVSVGTRLTRLLAFASRDLASKPSRLNGTCKLITNFYKFDPRGLGSTLGAVQKWPARLGPGHSRDCLLATFLGRDARLVARAAAAPWYVRCICQPR